MELIVKRERIKRTNYSLFVKEVLGEDKKPVFKFCVYNNKTGEKISFDVDRVYYEEGLFYIEDSVEIRPGLSINISYWIDETGKILTGICNDFTNEIYYFSGENQDHPTKEEYKRYKMELAQIILEQIKKRNALHEDYLNKTVRINKRG